MKRSKAHQKRMARTINFLLRNCQPPAEILDLGTENELSTLIKAQGFEVKNTSGQDLDLDDTILKEKVDLVTAFEILEHLVSPFTVLKNIKASKLIATVPLRLWFSSAYRNPDNEWDRHFHEFEDWQFDWLLEKAGWRIITSEKWTSPSSKIGFKPFLRRITPRFYAVYCERKR